MGLIVIIIGQDKRINKKIDPDRLLIQTCVLKNICLQFSLGLTAKLSTHWPRPTGPEETVDVGKRERGTELGVQRPGLTPRLTT